MATALEGTGGATAITNAAMEVTKLTAPPAVRASSSAREQVNAFRRSVSRFHDAFEADD